MGWHRHFFRKHAEYEQTIAGAAGTGAATNSKCLHSLESLDSNHCDHSMGDTYGIPPVTVITCTILHLRITSEEGRLKYWSTV